MRINALLCLLTIASIEIGVAHAANQVSRSTHKETESTQGYWPKDGLVPDARTAIAIAVAVWEPVYGKKEIAAEAPYQAVLKNDRWTVTGTLPDGSIGGTAFAVIAKKDARIIKMYHTK